MEASDRQERIVLVEIIDRALALDIEDRAWRESLRRQRAQLRMILRNA